METPNNRSRCLLAPVLACGSALLLTGCTATTSHRPVLFGSTAAPGAIAMAKQPEAPRTAEATSTSLLPMFAATSSPEFNAVSAGLALASAEPRRVASVELLPMFGASFSPRLAFALRVDDLPSTAATSTPADQADHPVGRAVAAEPNP